ncbi:hypothetical protein D3C87_1420690 [compost metagenome]
MAEWQAWKIVKRKGIIRLHLAKARIGDDGGRARTCLFCRLVEQYDAAGFRALSGKSECKRR